MAVLPQIRIQTLIGPQGEFEITNKIRISFLSDNTIIKAIKIKLFSHKHKQIIFVTFTPFVNGFAKLPATLVSERGCHVGIYFKRVGFE